MNGGLNTAPLASRPPPLVMYGDEGMRDMSCTCYPRARGGGKRFIKRNGIVLIYGVGDAIAVIADPVDLVAPESGGHTSPADAKLYPFVYKSRVWLRIADGRVGRVLDQVFTINTASISFPVTLNLEIIP